MKAFRVQQKRILLAYKGILPLIFPIAGDNYRLHNNWHVKRSPKRCSVDHSFDAERRAHNGAEISASLSHLYFGEDSHLT